MKTTTTKTYAERMDLAIATAIEMLDTPAMHAKRHELSDTLDFWAPSPDLRRQATDEARRRVNARRARA